MSTDLASRDGGQDDDLANELIEHNAAFRELLSRSLASPRDPFPFTDL